MEDVFAHMRPYSEEEVPPAIQTLLNAMDWKLVLRPFLGEKQTSNLLEGISSIQSVADFQDKVSKTFIQGIMQGTADEVTFSFPDNFEPTGALFISNHRDIVLDPSLINMALISRGAQTTEIGIGSNLLKTPWVEALVRLNKSFIVQRGGSLRDQLANSAEVAAYVRHVLLDSQSSVWLAQKDGRAKDGNDRTSPALVRMLMNGDGCKAWNVLNVHPVMLSYEWDPCDAMKVQELLLLEVNDGAYEKQAGEDERSMKQGLFGWKGNIHIAFGAPMKFEDKDFDVRPHQHVAEAIDSALYTSMKSWPSQHWAAAQIISEGLENSELPMEWAPDMVSEGEIVACEKRVRDVIESVQSSTSFDAKLIRNKWCEITARPLFNQIMANQHVSVGTEG